MITFIDVVAVEVAVVTKTVKSLSEANELKVCVHF